MAVCCKLIFALLLICYKVSAKCFDYHIQEALTSSRSPWENYFRISQAVYPTIDLSARLIKIWVKFVSQEAVTNYQDTPCDKTGNSTYTWSMSCLYVSAGPVSMFSMNLFSLGAIWPNRRETELCINLPQSCRDYLEKNEMEKMIYFLSTLEDVAIRPSVPDPSLNTAECVTPGHGKAPAFPGIKQGLHGVCWCILIIAVVTSTIASQFLMVKLREFCSGNEAVKKAERSKAAALVFLLPIVFIGGLVVIVLSLIRDQREFSNFYFTYVFYFLLVFLAVFLRRLIWCFYRNKGSWKAMRHMSLDKGHNSEGTSKNFFSCFVAYPALFVVFHHLLWILFGITTEPFWAFPVLVSVIAVLFVLYFVVYQFHKEFGTDVRNNCQAVFLSLLSFLVFVLLIFTLLLVGQAFLSDSLIANVVQGALVIVITYWFRSVHSESGEEHTVSPKKILQQLSSAIQNLSEKVSTGQDATGGQESHNLNKKVSQGLDAADGQESQNLNRNVRSNREKSDIELQHMLSPESSNIDRTVPWGRETHPAK